MARAIMIQGTMSNAGKSLIAAGLCRVFMQDGLRTAPFKAQNMALNSFITKEGLEMGRAQVVQAEAAGIEPSVLMNPILLKPTSDMGSQVIVDGEVYAQMGAREYFRIKRQLLPYVERAYGTLAERYDAIVIEGAGSPAEINLKNDDVYVNMGMAKLAKAPVLLVGDIDRGGVFAQLYGTIALLDADERELVRGIIINKFRGDKTILMPGVKQIEDMTGIPVVGVVPYMHVDIDDEDSLSERLGKKAVQLVDIAVIRLPRISNFTDFHTLEAMENVSVRYVRSCDDFGQPDLVILPGTKNTMADMLWLRQCGLEAKILRHADMGGAVLGICGGYQMLGKSLSDPCGTEEGGYIRGMGLLPVLTIFTKEKERTRVRGHFREMSGIFSGLTGENFEGYEIHMGRTESDNAICDITDSVSGTQKSDGCMRGNIYGTYVHGILDSDNVAGEVVRSLAVNKGIDPELFGNISMHEYKEKQYDILADGIRENMDMAAIYSILAGGVK